MGLFKPVIEELEKDNNIPALVKALSYRKAEIRLKAFFALYKQKDDPEISHKMKDLLDDKDPRVAFAVALRYAQDGDIGFDRLRKIVLEGTQHEKIDALRTLGAWKTEDKSDILNIVVLALNDKKPIIQIEAIRAMGELHDRTAIIHLEEKINDPVYTIRLEAVRSLGSIGNDEAVDLLIGSLTDNRQEIRRAARESLEDIKTERAIKALNDAPMMLIVKRMNESVASKQEVLKHIGKHRIVDALPLAKKACSDEYKNVRLEAVKTLAQFRDKSLIPTFVRMIEDPYYDIRLEAVKALERLTDLTSLNAVEKAMSDFNHYVREEAKKAYYSLKTRVDENEKKDK